MVDNLMDMKSLTDSPTGTLHIEYFSTMQDIRTMVVNEAPGTMKRSQPAMKIASMGQMIKIASSLSILGAVGLSSLSHSEYLNGILLLVENKKIRQSPLLIANSGS